METKTLKALILGALACTLSCSGEVAVSDLEGGASTCARPEEGCPCPAVGDILDCGEVESRSAHQVTCALGQRECGSDGLWGACETDRTGAWSTNGARPQALGTPKECDPTFDVCDPYCHITADAPGGFSAGTGFSNTAAGLTLVGTYKPQCTSLTLTPSTTNVTISGSSIGAATAAPVTFTLTAAPAQCVGATFPVTWAVDRFDRASITGTNNTNGQLTVAVPIGGPLVVRAYGGGLNTQTTINVKVNVLEAPTTDPAATPNVAASAARISGFGSLASPLAGSGASTASWLYPYANTVFPLVLPAPIVQYLYTRSGSDSTTAASAVKVSLRYPAGSTPATATFNYSLIVKESNSVSCAEDSTNCNFLDPQVTIPQQAWRYFELSARGTSGTLAIQRLREQSSGSPILETETTRNVSFVDGQLKGTVFYNSYSSPQAGDTGAILSIQPGATSPTLAVSPSGTCTTCHSINNSGTRLIANGAKVSGSYTFDTSQVFDMTTASPAPSTVGSFTNNRYTFGGPWLDGKYYMSHGSGVEWHAPSGSSGFYSTTNSTTAVTVTGWPTNVSGYTPRFSPAGDRLAFTFLSGTSLACSSNAISPCSGSPKVLGAASGMTRMTVMDFSCNSPPCNSNSTGFKVSNARDVTPGVTDRVAWPTFSSDGKLLAYQRQIRSSKSVLSWAASDVGTIAGALAEVWASNVPTDGSTSAVPVRLNALNGRNADGTSYLPQKARTVIDDTKPLYTFRVDRFETFQTAGSSPVVTITGIPTGNWIAWIKITNSGSVGSAKFQYSTDNQSSWSGTLTTAASVKLGSTGLTAQFANTASYSTTSLYKWRTGSVRVKGTPVTSGQNVRLKITTTGARGTARFAYSTDGGSTYSSALTTAATVSLGATGLVAEFDNITYESTSWAWGTKPVHYHLDGASYPIIESDSCSNNGNMSSTYDTQVNYLPSFAPQTVGGKEFVIFTSRRMYGTVAAQDPWDPEPSLSCSSGKAQAKKLWVAAVDPNASPGTDSSSPAFYLPGQETAAGNSDAYWVGSACTAVEGACDTDEDCCGGTGSGATAECRVVSTATFPPSKLCKARNTCSLSGQSCVTGSDCCTGLLCPSGGGLCYAEPPLLFEDQTYSRVYDAVCPMGTQPKWRFFEWQATIPTGTSIEFFAQTRDEAGDSWTPSTPLLVATATASSAANQWLRGAAPTGHLFTNQGIGNLYQLQVTMVFHPNSERSLAPTLLNWRQIYDCLPGE